MQILTTLLFALISTTVLAQQKTTQKSTTIDDNGTTLIVKIFANTDKGIINYKNEFYVKGMNQAQKDMIINSIMDSLGLSKTHNSVKEKTPNTPALSTLLSGDKELWKLAEKFNSQQVEQFNKGDMLGVAQFYSDDAMIYHPGKIYQGREAINKYWQDIKNAKNWKLTITEVGGNKKSFWVAGLSELTELSNNVEKTFASNYIVIMQPDNNGEYKIYKDIYNQAAKK